MALEERNPAGGHTMKMESEEGYLVAGCNLTGCHGDVEEINEYRGIQPEMEGLLDSLHTLLLDRNWITASGSINASTSNPLIIKPAYLSGALYNYFFVEHDLSLGIHNTKYTRDLLKSSIEVLTAE
jgi:hypothetical protein